MSGAWRQPAVAGTFYPAEPERLRRLADRLLADAAAAPARPNVDPARVLGLLVPHAGLVFSGGIAARAWSVAAETAPTTIVLAGTDHQAWAAGVGV